MAVNNFSLWPRYYCNNPRGEHNFELHKNGIVISYNNNIERVYSIAVNSQGDHRRRPPA